MGVVSVETDAGRPTRGRWAARCAHSPPRVHRRPQPVSMADKRRGGLHLGHAIAAETASPLIPLDRGSCCREPAPKRPLQRGQSLNRGNRVCEAMPLSSLCRGARTLLRECSLPNGYSLRMRRLGGIGEGIGKETDRCWAKHRGERSGSTVMAARGNAVTAEYSRRRARSGTKNRTCPSCSAEASDRGGEPNAKARSGRRSDSKPTGTRNSNVGNVKSLPLTLLADDRGTIGMNRQMDRSSHVKKGGIGV